MNKRSRRILTILLALVLLVGLFHARVFPAATAEDKLPIDADHFPDENFREFVRGFDTDQDGYFSGAERGAVDTIDCMDHGVTSMEGIEYFPALKILNSDSNCLTSLDVSKNTMLRSLSCSRNQLTSLDLSRNLALTEISCGLNQLTELRLGRNTALEGLWCGGNQLTSLDVSGNTALKNLFCNNNRFTSLFLRSNTALEGLWCYDNQLSSLDVSGNTALSYLYCSNNPLTALNLSKNQTLAELDCCYTQLTALDLRKNPALIYLNCVENQLTALDVSCNPALEQLNCDENQLTSLDVSVNPALTELTCSNNRLAALDVRENTALESLWCADNQLTELDVSRNTALTELICADNRLTKLDLSRNTALRNLSCQNNRIKVLDISANPPLEYVLRFGTREQEEIRCNLFYGLDEYDNFLTLCFDYLTTVRLSNGKTYRTSVSEIFSDVKDSAYYADAVLWAVQNGITSGTGEGTFSPKDPCTCAQIVTFLYCAAGKPEHHQTESPFTDVKPGKWYYDAVMWAYENEITGGVGDGLFGVQQGCTRGQAMTFLWKSLGAPEPETEENPFEDVAPGKYYYKAVLWALENGITSGTGETTFGTGDTCTRAQIVTFLYKAYAE